MVGRAGGVRGGLSGPVSVFLEGGAGIGRPEPLFRKVSEKELQEKREKLAAA
jgi:hypothetical protein